MLAGRHSLTERAPRFHAETPRPFVVPPTPKDGDPSVFHFSVTTSHQSSREERITDVPRSVTSHSPDGFWWGSRGSGAQELALNILNHVVPPGSDGYEPIPCSAGYASRTAFQLYGLYTNEVISQLSQTGESRIAVDEVKTWVRGKSATIGAFPRRNLLPEVFSNPTITPLERSLCTSSTDLTTVTLPTSTDQSDWALLSKKWQDKHLELASINQEVRDAVYVHLRGVLQSAHDINPDWSHRHKELYSEAISLGRRLNSIDLELCRSETLGETHNISYISCNLPTGIAQAVDKLIVYYEQEAHNVRELYRKLGPDRIAAELMHGRVVPCISIVPKGPVLIVACGTNAAWQSIQARIMGVGKPACMGFAATITIDGNPLPILALPAALTSMWNLTSQGNFRSTLLHEREHGAQRFRNCSVYSDEFLENPQPREAVVSSIATSFMYELADEVLAFSLTGDWNPDSRRELVRSGSNAFYDYPSLIRDFWLKSCSKMLPGLSVDEHYLVIGEAAGRFYLWREELFQALRDLDTNHQGGVHAAFRAIDLFPVESWPKHLQRMRDVGLF